MSEKVVGYLCLHLVSAFFKKIPFEVGLIIKHIFFACFHVEHNVVEITILLITWYYVILPQFRELLPGPKDAL